MLIPDGTVGVCNNPAQNGIAPVKIFLKTANQVIRQRLHRLCRVHSVFVYVRIGLQRNRLQNSHRKPAGGPSRDFRCSPDVGKLGHLHHLGMWTKRGRMPDPAGIEQIVSVKIKSKNIVSLNKKRPFFLKIRFEGRQIHDRGISLYLSEIGINSRIQCEIVCKPDLGIQPSSGSESDPFCVRIPGYFLAGGYTAGNIRRQFQAPVFWQSLQTVQFPESINPSRSVVGQ